MIRPFTCICLLLAAASGLYLYQAKHSGQMLDREVERVLRAADEMRARTGVLRAEYALLNDPQRLQELASAHLKALATTAPQQFTALADLGGRLPPVGQPTPPPLPIEPSLPGLAASLVAPTREASVTVPAAAHSTVSDIVPVNTAAGGIATAHARFTAAPKAAQAILATTLPGIAPVAEATTTVAQENRSGATAHPVRRPATLKIASRAPAKSDPFSIPAAMPTPRTARTVDPPAKPPVRSALGMARSLSASSLAPSATYYPASSGGAVAP